MGACLGEIVVYKQINKTNKFVIKYVIWYFSKPTKYGFAEKVLDGIYLSINTLSVSFTSIGFKASVNISRIIVQSTGPDWRPTKNLRHTRVKDDILGEVMIFKEIKWSTMRVDADASYKPEVCTWFMV